MGQTFAGRVAGSLLRAAGMPELIASSTQEYEATALELVRKPKQLAGYRQKLEQNRLRMPLFDIDRFTKNIEAAFRSMWETWSAGRAPTS